MLQRPCLSTTPEGWRLMEEVLTNTGERLDNLAENTCLLMVFLRHFGCSFCRETMTDLSQVRDQLEELGVQPIMVHMVSSKLADQILPLYNLDDIPHISDPEKTLYSRFGFTQTNWKHIMHPTVLWRSFMAGVVKGHLAGKPVGDPYQMPGLILYKDKKVLNKFVYQRVCDRPDFINFAKQL